ncbi:MAG: lysophospholipid acyltransferase family protein [Rhodospirillaceae bacterium]|nr:lysophospholipid acyltransferase family protein [Rhodospirillaceae bacterium]
MTLGNKVKHWSRRPGVRRGLGAVTTAHIKLVKAANRWTGVNGEVMARAWRGEQPVIVAFWHQRLALMPYCWPSAAPFHMLISSHPDGQLISAAVAAFGISTVAGSTTRGGGEALRHLIRKLKAGESVGITPDGPRGPARVAQDGVIALARLSGAPIVPVAVAVSRRMNLKTWDRLIIGLPFGRGVQVWGDAIHIPRDADDATLEALRLRVEVELNRVSDAADALTGATTDKEAHRAPA